MKDPDERQMIVPISSQAHVIIAPSPGALFALIDPPCPSTIFFAIASPIHVLSNLFCTSSVTLPARQERPLGE